jgi:uncharacterized membrane protein
MCSLSKCFQLWQGIFLFFLLCSFNNAANLRQAFELICTAWLVTIGWPMLPYPIAKAFAALFYGTAGENANGAKNIQT